VTDQDLNHYTTARVRIRCAKCRAILKRVEIPEGADPRLAVSFRRCRKCDVPPPGALISVLVATNRASLGLMGETSIQSMTEAIAESRRRSGRWVDLAMRVSGDPSR